MTKVASVELQRGPAAAIIGIVMGDGTCPSEEFLSGLNDQAQTQFKARFERLTTVGHLINPDQMRLLQVDGQPRVWEIKAHCGPGWRLYVVQEGRCWVATHGTKKVSDKKVPKEVAKARKIYEERKK
jgi:putative component of toxin-antitoxin plasmid stabilization module